MFCYLNDAIAIIKYCGQVVHHFIIFDLDLVIILTEFPIHLQTLINEGSFVASVVVPYDVEISLLVP